MTPCNKLSRSLSVLGLREPVFVAELQAAAAAAAARICLQPGVCDSGICFSDTDLTHLARRETGRRGESESKKISERDEKERDSLRGGRNR